MTSSVLVFQTNCLSSCINSVFLSFTTNWAVILYMCALSSFSLFPIQKILHFLHVALLFPFFVLGFYFHHLCHHLYFSDYSYVRKGNELWCDARRIKNFCYCCTYSTAHIFTPPAAQPMYHVWPWVFSKVSREPVIITRAFHCSHFFLFSYLNLCMNCSASFTLCCFHIHVVLFYAGKRIE